MSFTFVIPSHNNLRHLKNCYASIKRHASNCNVVFIDDASTDGTHDWLESVSEDDEKVNVLRSKERQGHTILYDVGIDTANTEVVGILHADMIIGPNYVENLTKHLKEGTVVCATRVEPPLHPPGKEKIIRDFGLDFDTLDVKGFESFAVQQQEVDRDRVTFGMFAPWAIHKSDFKKIGGHDPLFAPFPYEDSDIFQRWILAGYKLIQSRDAFVYHLTCRGHRWNSGIGVEDEYFKKASNNAARNYIRKWGSWIANDEYQMPLIKNKYDVAFVVKDCDYRALMAYEPFCDAIYIRDEYDQITRQYIESEQRNTMYDMSTRVYAYNPYTSTQIQNDIVVEFAYSELDQESSYVLTHLSDVITDSGEVGQFEIGNIKITINKLETYQHNLVHCNKESNHR